MLSAEHKTALDAEIYSWRNDSDNPVDDLSAENLANSIYDNLSDLAETADTPEENLFYHQLHDNPATLPYLREHCLDSIYTSFTTSPQDFWNFLMTNHTQRMLDMSTDSDTIDLLAELLDEDLTDTYYHTLSDDQRNLFFWMLVILIHPQVILHN